jgi:hypothetical protein
MNLLRLFRVVVRTLTRNKVRSVLMMAGVTIGITSLTVLISIG